MSGGFNHRDTEGTRLALVTGEVGVGKTTVAGRVVELVRVRGCVCAGLWAPARVVGGQKAGIEAVDLRSGECRLLARTATQGAGEQVGPYTFDPAVLAWANQVLVDAIATRPDLLVVDEIGPLELERGRGLAPVLEPLAAGRVPRALVVVRAWLLDALRARLPGIPTATFAVCPKTRKSIPEQVVNWLYSRAADHLDHQPFDRAQGRLLRQSLS
jgi:nucleoside-triphosphatase THEP1